MNRKKANIDSLNFRSNELEKMFMNHKHYRIETVKSICVFKPNRWLEEFGKSFSRNIVEAKILHTDMGLSLPIKRYAVNPHMQTLEFAGLRAYTDKSKLLSNFLNELIRHLNDEVITRVDVALDFREKVPSKVLKALKASRIPYSHKHTNYLKTDREGKTNSHINICIYPKHIKENLDYAMERLEFSFRGSYFRGDFLIKDLDKALAKMKKTIKRFTGLEVDIQPL